MQIHHSLRTTIVWVFGLIVLSTTACIVTPAPSIRGWRCEKPTDCLGILDCYEGFCRASCDDDLDCNKLDQETCSSAKYCVPPGPTCTQGQTRPCYTGPKGTEGKGSCKSGIQKCTSKKEWGNCQNQVTPKDEKLQPCNGTDDDCDGKIDNGVNCQCKPGSRRSCYGSGLTGCTNKSGTYSCVGICKAGTQLCNDRSTWGKCTGWKGPETHEQCNGDDDDCDGKIDENPIKEGSSCTVPGQQGPCKEGKSKCENGVTRCIPTYTKRTEDCNGIDDDCDGKVDNIAGSSAPIRRACYTGSTGCTKSGALGYQCKGSCTPGFQVCLLNQQTWAKTCDGEVLPKTQETCNKKDDNCNGTIDDFTIEAGKSCSTTQVGICKAGTTQCTAGKVVCKAKNKPGIETCNNLDDDCNGRVDDGSSLCPSGKSCVKGSCQ